MTRTLGHDRAHFLTEHGALCGASRPQLLAVNPADTTCWACWTLLEAGIRERSAAGRGAPLGVIPTVEIRRR